MRKIWIAPKIDICSVLKFGKYQGKIFLEVVNKDFKYVSFLVKNKLIKLTDRSYTLILHLKIKRIRIKKINEY